MQLERGQKPKARRFQGPKAPFTKMRQTPKELKANPGSASSERRRPSLLVQEMPYAGEDHGHSEAVGGGNHIVIADRAAGLNDGNGTGFGGFFDAVGEREKGV